MEWKELSKGNSKKILNELQENNNFEPKCDEEYLELKQELKKAFSETYKELNIETEYVPAKNKYKFDCIFGLKIYKIFSEGKYKLNEREASNDNIWRYIHMNVVPDIIYKRWDLKWNEDRYYEKSNRLYLKILWWYVYLSLNKSIEETKEILMNEVNSTDTIAQLVERIGQNGYRIELYRTIMQKKYEMQVKENEFRKLMVLNSAKIKVINPYLVNGGVEEYVKELIEEIRKG